MSPEAHRVPDGQAELVSIEALAHRSQQFGCPVLHATLRVSDCLRRQSALESGLLDTESIPKPSKVKAHRGSIPDITFAQAKECVEIVEKLGGIERAHRIADAIGGEQ